MSKTNMVRLKGGIFQMGANGPEVWDSDGERPVRPVKLRPFYIDMFAVSNCQFEKFIASTSHVTDAERFDWSYVFTGLANGKHKSKKSLSHVQTPWWLGVKGAYWKNPEGPGSSISKRMNHPVVHISWNDALAYAKWADKRLPTESEWEYAARGGLEGRLYPWGDNLLKDGVHHCNIWQGQFPHNNTLKDGFRGTAPVDTFPSNGFGLYNMIGNVWEWCYDWWSVYFRGGRTAVNPDGPPSGAHKVMRGGSYLCHDSYCNRYRNSARTYNTPDTSTGNIGFRCASNA
ncbi:MAG: formylglycine-generating enzyme family protein [Opitutae bacterium]|nr:formylglycine-generating enzyme family protein [Opitutae bacterium]MBT5378640.1 formylglycine-generating enzyme family protein [Opitutae bacterium]MBT5692264.1 formylglycine-generating enzyme family protein [Opitutae bacterium]MBT7851781.1 formylglycine-generating enzyme family protein [Opitutae bacterium]